MALGKLLNKLMPAGENLDGLFYCDDEVMWAAKSFCCESRGLLYAKHTHYSHLGFSL